MNPRHPNAVGISLASIKLRHNELAGHLGDIEQLWLRMSDIEDVLEMEVRQNYPWT